MLRKLVIVILIAFFTRIIWGQSETYTIKKASFSSDKYDEFSPVFYKNGIVFTSNRNLGLSYHSTSQNKGLFKIYYIDTTGKADWESAKLFSKNLATILNDGPVTFNRSRDTIYFSRNQNISGKLSDISGPRNKLGIFSAVLVAGQWTKVRELRINNEWYNVTTPCLSPDGKKLFFASDKPGGFGGSDLYYSQWKDNRWEDPVNLGPVINTKGNESYPYINPSGELFFSSDGQPGHGGKDIFFSLSSDSTWLTPVCLDAPINSEFDDFGIVTDTLMNEGYFSSNRDKTIDIYHFKTNSSQIFYSNIQRENQYCFMLNDSGAIVIDTLNLKYIWDFGDGEKATGAKERHCFPAKGRYSVKLDVFDKATGKLFFSKLAYTLEIKDYKQPFISSPDFVIKGDTAKFDGLRSNIPGFKILSYSWDFRDGNKSSGGIVKHVFKEKGEYLVNMELILKSISTGYTHKTGVSKKVLVLNDKQERESYLAKMDSVRTSFPFIEKYENNQIKTQYSAESEFRKDAVFNVELLSSKTKIGIDSWTFRNVPKKYIITEKFIPEDSTYSYIVDQQMTLMATYPAYSELFALGFKNVRIKIFVLTAPAEKELHNLIKINGAFADSYFDTSDRLTSNAYIMLDQIVKLMNKYPSMKLEVAVHSDNTGPAATSLALSQLRARLLVGYLMNRGINTKRLIATGFGGSKPIAPNFLEKDRKLNRRIDFIILNK
ncbi:MAG: PKD domain-containing protein [Bacteroidales bacterium]|jgi:outer membrane protein OmpA-like peptidoglycan-associated protein